MTASFERLKELSTWHFDASKLSSPGNDSYFKLGTIVDLPADEIVERFTHQAKKESWRSVGEYNTNSPTKVGTPESIAEKIQELEQLGLPSDLLMFERIDVKSDPTVKSIVDYLGLVDANVKFHNQRPGQILLTHFDDFRATPDSDEIMRFIVALDDWHWGQVFNIGNAFWQWRTGDIIYWDWKNMPHSTCNSGLWDRPMLQITGRMTEKTAKVLTRRVIDPIWIYEFFW